jgi:hypothetical protein
MEQHKPLNSGNPRFQEPHYTVRELVTMWRLSDKTIRRLLQSELGVIAIQHPKPHKRIYRSLRIPESVANRVYRRITNGCAA